MKKFISVFLSVLILFTLNSCSFLEPSLFSSIPEDTKLLVHYIDVGQGDCTLLESDGEFVLIDAGEVEYGEDVCHYIKKRGAKNLSYVIATHPHSDHCGGLTEVLQTFDCDNFITVETDQHTQTWLNVLQTVEERDINYIDAEVSNTYSFGNTTFEIMGPYSGEYDNYNNYSVVIKAICSGTSFLFTGDAETQVEYEMLKNGADLKADVLKVGHHGSSTSSSEEFINAVGPTYGIISCGLFNDYGHPHSEIINRMEQHDVTLFRTDELGSIIACSNGQSISFFYENTEDRNIPSYVGNKNSKKFHLPSCEGAKNMSKKNMIIFYSRSDAVTKGYSPCKTCNP